MTTNKDAGREELPFDFIGWCASWFGGDSDESYLARAIADLDARRYESPPDTVPRSELESANRLSNNLLGIIGRISDALGISEEDQSVANGDEEILFAIEELQAKAVPVLDRDKIREAIADSLGDAYDCLRVWSAWSYGTMGPDDFSLVAEDGDRLDEIVDAVILSAAPAPAASPYANEDADTRAILEADDRGELVSIGDVPMKALFGKGSAASPVVPEGWKFQPGEDNSVIICAPGILHAPVLMTRAEGGQHWRTNGYILYHLSMAILRASTALPASDLSGSD